MSACRCDACGTTSPLVSFFCAKCAAERYREGYREQVERETLARVVAFMRTEAAKSVYTGPMFRAVLLHIADTIERGKWKENGDGNV